jgi:hypothetical protein
MRGLWLPYELAYILADMDSVYFRNVSYYALIRHRLRLLCPASALTLVAALCFAGHANAQGLGAITGVVRDLSSNAPVGGATVTMAKSDNSGIRATVSGSDGLYSFADVPVGSYRITVEANGRSDSGPASLQVVTAKATRADFSMVAAVAPVPGSSPAVPVTVSSAVPTPADAAGPKAAGTPFADPKTAARALSTYAGSHAPATTQNSATRPDIWTRWIKGESLSWRDLVEPPAKTTGNEVASLNKPPASAFDKPVTDNQAGAAPGAPEAASPPVDPNKKIDPFSDYDWTWLNGNSREKDSPLDGKYFSGEFRADTHYGLDFNQPVDHTMGGSSELFRSGEVQLEELALGGDFHVDNVRGRVLYLVGLFSTTTPRNDASAAVGQWDVRDAYRYVSEAYGGYHFNVNYGLNIDAGIFVSYVGLFSYHNFDNWAYQPSYVSSNTPWFFNGVRVQWFPTKHLKIEPWFINGWQSYNKFNSHPGLGGQLKWTPNSRIELIANQYGYGEDTLGIPHRQRYHTDDSIEFKYYENPAKLLDRMALTFTGDLGCESGGGVSCTGKGAPKQAFLGYMAYNRFWFKHDLFGMTLGGGQISNPGRYLTLVLPINGADAISGTPYFPGNPGSQFKAWDSTATFDYMPKQFITYRLEFGYRHANVPYFTGRRGITPPGGNNGYPADYVCNDGAPSATGNCSNDGGLWTPDLRKSQALLLGAIMVKF